VKKSSTAPRPLPTTDAVPAKLAPKQFKPIPDGAPAKELGEYLRAMIRAADVTLDRVAAAGGMAKNTLTTTMDGRSKGWPSIQEWLNAYSKAVGTPPYARQIDDIRRLFQRGQQNHRNALRSLRATKSATSTTEPPAQAPTAGAAAGGGGGAPAPPPPPAPTKLFMGIHQSGTQSTGTRVPRSTFSAVEPNRISSAGVDCPRMPITIIGRSRSRVIFRISTKGRPTTIIFSMST
jgi:hypothetical protein